MPPDATNYGQMMDSKRRQRTANVMFDFINKISSADTTDEVRRNLSTVAVAFGLENFAISGIPLPGEKIDPYVLLNAWPVEWSERYVTESFVHVDPVIYRAKVSDEAFIWSRDVLTKPIGSKARRVMSGASDFGMVDGLSVPLHMPGGLQAIVTFGSTQRVDVPREVEGVFHVVAIFAHNRLRAILDEQRSVDEKVIPNITPHERDVIRWAAEGKTSWEIGCILGRSEKTVQHELQNAQRKMNCVNRAQLVAEAIRIGIIR